MRAVLPLLALLALPGAVPGEIPTDLPAAKCSQAETLPPVSGFSKLVELSKESGPWLDYAADPDADPSVPGYIELLRFRVLPSGGVGMAIAVRLAGSEDHASLFPGETRSWALVVDTGRGDYAIEYAYIDPEKPDDLWAYRPELRRIFGFSRVRLSDGAPTTRLCRALGTAGLAREVVILERTTGWVAPDKGLRRAIDLHRGRCR